MSDSEIESPMAESRATQVQSSPEIVDERLIDLQSVRGTTAGLFGPILCRVVNMYSEHEFPWKFVYEACSHRFPNGKRCLSSRRLGRSCHSSDNTVIAYRLMIYLMDGSVESDPVGVTAFDDVNVLLGMSAVEFHGRSNDEQLDLISKCSVQFPQVKAWIRVRGDSLTLHSVSVLTCNSALSKRVNHRGTSSSVKTAAAGRRQVSFEEFSDMKRALNDVYELLAGEKRNTENADTGGSTEIQSGSISGISGSGSNEETLFCTMNRKELQSLCKKYLIPANRSNAYMIEALESKFKKVAS